jgi:hypothetical protein
VYSVRPTFFWGLLRPFSYSNVVRGENLLERTSVVHTSSQQERDRIEADLLLAVVFAHMAYHTAKSFSEDVTARRQFIDTVRALHHRIEGAVDAPEFADRPRLT